MSKVKDAMVRYQGLSEAELAQVVGDTTVALPTPALERARAVYGDWDLPRLLKVRVNVNLTVEGLQRSLADWPFQDKANYVVVEREAQDGTRTRHRFVVNTALQARTLLNNALAITPGIDTLIAEKRIEAEKAALAGGGGLG